MPPLIMLALPSTTPGVAYVKYDRASSAALAIENLHEVTLNDGRGPRLKVILAESPHMRCLPWLLRAEGTGAGGGARAGSRVCPDVCTCLEAGAAPIACAMASTTLQRARLPAWSVPQRGGEGDPIRNATVCPIHPSPPPPIPR